LAPDAPSVIAGVAAPARAGNRATLYRRSSPAMLVKILYWLAVLAVSLALVVGLILFLESRDRSSIEGTGQPGLTTA
jgi:hypothetical protein